MENRFLARAESALILLMVAGFVLIIQRVSFLGYQFGLLTVMAATLLNIAVSNTPKAATGWRAARAILLILLIAAALFGIGILLVPFLASLGQ